MLNKQLKTEGQMIFKEDLKNEGTMSQLPPHQADILKAHYIHGETVVNYAKRVGIPIPTAKARRAKGVQSLKAVLKSR